MLQHRHRRRKLRLLVLCLALLSMAPGCVTRTVKTPVVEQDGITILLRHDSKGRKPVERDFEHPASISEERLAHILSALYIRTEEDGPDQQRTAIPSDLIYPIAKGLSQAYKISDSNQEIAVMAVRKQSRLGILNDKFLTSFVTFIQEGSLYVVFSRVDWNLEKMNKKSGKNKKKIPEPHVDDDYGKFRTVGSPHLKLAGRTGVGAIWREPYWQQTAHIYRTGSGVVIRRTVLMESEVPPEERIQPLRPDDLPTDPAVLRELADLSERRAAGEITEYEYQRRRAELMEK
jgi:hypothetical protein